MNNNRALSIIFSIFSLTVLVLFFQNCSDGGVRVNSSSSSSSSSEAAEPQGLEPAVVAIEILKITDSGPENSCLINYRASSPEGETSLALYIDGVVVGTLTKSFSQAVKGAEDSMSCEDFTDLQFEENTQYSIRLAIASETLKVESESSDVVYQLDSCRYNPQLGQSCAGGTVYAGDFGGRLMITPSGCTDSPTPTCDGRTDTVNKSWKGAFGEDATIPGLESIKDQDDGSNDNFSGDIATPLIASALSTSEDSVAHYCENMTFGGYDDWYLPSKSEMVYIYCFAETLFPSNGVPQEAPGCFGGELTGKSFSLPGFAQGGYWTSSQQSDAAVWAQSFTNGAQYTDVKSTLRYVRCMRNDRR